MKTFNIILSAFTLLATTILLIVDFPNLKTFNGIIYFSLLVVLLLVCVTGIIINTPRLTFKRRHRFGLSFGKH
ncbi:MAG: hypothetical protein CMP77_03305 [Flavobacterium sp.]|nr:hypothetical protein [Flavobacterium sp.]